MKALLKSIADWAAPRAKAVAAGLVPALLAYLSLKSDGVTADEWALILGLLLGGGAITYAVPNAKQSPK